VFQVSARADFKKNVANWMSCSNIKDIATGTGLNGGNIEFLAKPIRPGKQRKRAECLSDV